MAQIIFNNTYRPINLNKNNADEDIILNGNYKMSLFRNSFINEDNYLNICSNSLLFCKESIILANVFYRTNTENIEKYINLLIKYSYDSFDNKEDNSDVYKNKIKTIMESENKNLKVILDSKTFDMGMVCPSKELFFELDNKLFYIYGRYIFGYNQQFVMFKNINFLDEDEEEENNDDNINYKNNSIKNDSIKNDTIVNKILNETYNKNDSTYSESDYEDTSEYSESDHENNSTYSESDHEDCGEYYDTRYEGKYIHDNTDLFYENHPEFINDKFIKLYMPKDKYMKKIISDYVYSFKIVDKTTNILDAFGLYR